MSDYIEVKGAKEHNLQNIDVKIPRDKLVVITGVSGSGKSSLAFDTIFAEGQRRYLESLSSYARQFLGLRDKPAVEHISGLSPVISIDQKSTSRNNPRSTVATVTEIYDYLRLLFARVGIAHGPDGQPIKSLSTDEIVEAVLELPADHRLLILAPVVIDKKGEHAHIPEIYRRQGYSRARIDGIVYDLDEFPDLDKNLKHSIEIVIDRLVNRSGDKSRLSQSVEAGLGVTTTALLVIDVDDNDRAHQFSQRYYNPDFPDFIPPEMEPRTFSFNSPHGACPACAGLGQRQEVDPELVIPNGNLTLAEGAVRPFNRLRTDRLMMDKLRAVGEEHGFDLQTRTGDIPAAKLRKILYGTGSQTYAVAWGRLSIDFTYNGVIPELEKRYQEASDTIRREIERYMIKKPCQECGGQRLKPAVRAVTVGGQSIAAITKKTVLEARDFLAGLKLDRQANLIAEPILTEIGERLGFLEQVGLEYLTLDRAANTLSGGEAQRIRLATQIGSGLQGVLYVLDEPSIGLHQRDNHRLLQTLQRLRDLGNSLLVVEHDEATIRTADYVVDVGPGAGAEGGQIMALGSPAEITANRDSLTGDYLAGRRKIATPKKVRPPRGWLEIKGAQANNLKNINVKLPLGVLTVVSGVSGSGKSTLINDILARELHVRLHRTHQAVGRHQDITGLEALDKVIIIDQSPIGRTPRSNAATYVGLYTPIRDLFAATPQARQRGYGPGRFSFNVAGGRCEACRGDGTLKKEMHFLPDIYVDCDVCSGRRYMDEVLQVTYKGKNISDVLRLRVAEAADFFGDLPAINNRIRTLQAVGLDYIALGQAAPTLSGGEAQRVKLAKELSKRASGRTLYILDEPTTGLHMDDIKRLLEILHRLVDNGNSVITIEHNLDIIKNADWLIDMGPEGGHRGGQVVASGPPAKVALIKQSHTGQFLAELPAFRLQ